MYAVIPTPLTINLDLDSDAGRGFGGFVATSPQYPGLSGTSSVASDAVAELTHHIVESIQEAYDAMPLTSEMVDALLDGGYSPELIEKWDKCMRGNLREFRYNLNRAIAILDEYAYYGVPATTACEFMCVGVGSLEAAELHAAGHTPQDCLPYMQEAESTGWWHGLDFDVVEWILAGCPAERVRIYLNRCSPTQAVAWEAVVHRHHISDTDLRDMLRAGFTAQDFDDNASAYAKEGLSLADAARTQLALILPESDRSHLPSHASEPPF